MDRSEPLSCGNLVANDYAANISGLNQQFDVCLNLYSVIRICPFRQW